MKKLLVLLAAGALVFSVHAQDVGSIDPEETEEAVQVQEGMPEVDMDNLPEDVRAEVQTAVEEAEQASDAVQEMAKQGVSEQEIEATVTQARESAQQEIETAIDALDGLPEEAKEQAQKAVEDAKKVLEEKKEEIKSRRNKAEEAAENAPEE